MLPPATGKMPDEITVSGPDEGSPAEETTAELTADEIRERMALIRLRIDEQSDEVVAQVNALSDWRSYVRRYPWASVGAAAVLGYVLVPSRAKPDAEDSTRDTKKHPAAFTTDELRSVLIGAARKAATTYVGKTLGSVVNSFVAADDQRPTCSTEGDSNEWCGRTRNERPHDSGSPREATGENLPQRTVDWGRSVTAFIVEHPEELCLGIALKFGVAIGVVVKRR